MSFLGTDGRTAGDLMDTLQLGLVDLIRPYAPFRSRLSDYHERHSLSRIETHLSLRKP